MRSAHKRGVERPRYGSKKRSSVRGKKAKSWETLSAADEKLFLNALYGDKAAVKKIREFNLKIEREGRRTAQAHVVKRLPVLKQVKERLDAKLYGKLLDALVKELESAFDDGYDQAPRGSSVSGHSSRGDAWESVPAGSFIVSPYMGPPAPGPSGLS